MSFFDPSLFHTFSFVAIVIASVAGSLHCIGMCGGLAALASSGSRGPLHGQLGYHLGRGIGYVTLGALSGAFGEIFIDLVKKVLKPTSLSTRPLGIGVLLVLCVVALVFAKRRGDGLVEISPRSLLSRLRDRLAAIPFTLGISTVILPCPWLYSFVLLSAAGGTALIGAKVMTAFWLGTIPALLVVGTIFESGVRTALSRYPFIQIAFIGLAFIFSLSAHLAGH